MPRWPISDQHAREMYAGGRANTDARWFARFWGRLFAAGVFPRRWVTLEVPGRISGKVTSLPLGMADVDGRWYLVSMLGECNWVANVRANNGDAVLRRRRREERADGGAAASGDNISMFLAAGSGVHLLKRESAAGAVQ